MDNIIEIKENVPCYVIGTLFKEMKLKPNILTKMNAPLKIEKIDDYTQQSDQLYLEDDYGRIKLTLDNTQMEYLDGSFKQISTVNLLSGIVIAIYGQLEENNYFSVKQILYSGLSYQDTEMQSQSFKLPQEPSLVNPLHNYYHFNYYLQNNNHSNDRFIILLSGLEIDYNKKDFSYLSFQEFIKGNTVKGDLLNLIQRVERVIIAGNILALQEDLDCALIGSYKMKDVYNKIQINVAQSMKEADNYLENITQSIQVDLMPGENDPSTALFPQQPLNKCYFPKSSKNKNLKSVSNPYNFILDNIKMLGTSGQNVSDMKKYSKFSENDIELLEQQLVWSHIAPTAPDSLQCYPYSDSDHFFVDEIPHVYFVGNCNQFQTKMLYEQSTQKFCRLICVPRFFKTNSVVLLNLSNLDTFEISL